MIGECYSHDSQRLTWTIMCTQFSRERSPHFMTFTPVIAASPRSHPTFALDQYNVLCRLTEIYDRTDLLRTRPSLPVLWSRISAAKELHASLQYVSSGFSRTNEFDIGFFHLFVLAKHWRKIAGRFKSLGKQRVFDDIVSSGCSGVKVETSGDIDFVFENIESYIAQFGLKPVPASLVVSD